MDDVVVDEAVMDEAVVGEAMWGEGADKAGVDNALVEVRAVEEGIVEERVHDLVNCAHLPPPCCDLGCECHGAGHRGFFICFESCPELELV